MIQADIVNLGLSNYSKLNGCYGSKLGYSQAEETLLQGLPHFLFTICYESL